MADSLSSSSSAPSSSSSSSSSSSCMSYPSPSSSSSSSQLAGLLVAWPLQSLQNGTFRPWRWSKKSPKTPSEAGQNLEIQSMAWSSMLISGACLAVEALITTGTLALLVRLLRRRAAARAARRRFAEMLELVVGVEGRVVITGADAGVGLELARLFSQHPKVRMLLGCRQAPKLSQKLLEKASAGEEPYCFPRAFCLTLELLDFESTQSFAKEAHKFLAESNRPGLRLLINNAGIKITERDTKGQPPPRTKYGLSETWQTNFLSPFLITELIAKLRENAGPGVLNCPLRVVQVSSGREDESNLDRDILSSVLKGSVSPNEYADSKRALLLWTSVRAQSLAFKGSVFVHAANPGRVDTRLGLYWVHPWAFWLSKPVRALAYATLSEGALNVAAPGLHQQAAGKFGHYSGGEKMLEDLVIWRMPDKQLAVHLVRWATSATALEARSGGRPLSETGRPLSLTDLAGPGPEMQEDKWSTPERRWAHAD